MDWESLKLKYTDTLVEAVRDRIINGTSRQIETGTFSENGIEHREIMSLFSELHKMGIIKEEKLLSCPDPDCGEPIDYDIGANPECIGCGLNFEETGKRPEDVVKHFVQGQLSRDVPWLITLHGFNTLGEWHRDFSWLVANKIKYHAPVLMYQFPMTRYRVLLRWWHFLLAENLGKSIRDAIIHAEKNGITEPPDIVAHSFGSLVFVTLLDHPEFKDLRFGRVILAGGVVPPNYDFSTHIESGKCGHVLNHCSENDHVVKLAALAIPKSGPSGSTGLKSEGVFNVKEQDYCHGTYFKKDILSSNLATDGTWDRFLSLPSSYLPLLEKRFSPNSINWPPIWHPITAVSRLIFIVGIPVFVGWLVYYIALATIDYTLGMGFGW